MKKVLVVGATSAIAQAVSRIFAASGDSLYLIARDQERLESVAADLRVRGASRVYVAPFDAAEFITHAATIRSAINSLGGVDIALVAHGSLPQQERCEESFKTTLDELTINGLSVISVCTELANYMEKAADAGTIAVISSVAGDRGRQSNYLYGTAKGMVSIYLQGLRNRLYRSDIKVLTVKPGFVDTPMTASFPKGPLWASPEKVAQDIHQAIKRGKDVLYTPRFWWFIMLVIRAIPERIFKRLGL
jgi:decaprenylphospho-beta-D-erythro-pentofuranosid-2-ulose 2-reductase